MLVSFSPFAELHLELEHRHFTFVILASVELTSAPGLFDCFV